MSEAVTSQDNPPPPWPLNDLERLLEAASRDRAHEPAFIRALLEAQVFLLGAVGAGAAERDRAITAQVGDRITLRTHTDDRGRSYIPCFTSQVRLESAISQASGVVALSARDLFAMVRDKPIVLNPFGPFGKEFLPDETHSLLNPAHRPVTVAAGSQVLLGQLSTPPTELIESLRSALQGDRRCNAAYMGGVSFDPGQPHHPLLGLDCGPHFDAVKAAIDPILRAWISAGRTLDLIDVRRGGALTDYLKRDTRPFFKRSLLGRLLA